MSPDIQANLEIPDIWFDFLARLLPGISFVAIVWLGFLEKPTPTGLEAIVGLFFAGYIIGLVTSPASSRVAKLIEARVGKLPQGEKDRIKFIRKVQSKLGYSSRQALLISKMHAEVVFFVQLAIYSLLVISVEIYKSISFYPTIAITIALLPIFIVEAFEVASRRFERVNGVYEAIPNDDVPY
jgi:hypothetical protein